MLWRHYCLIAGSICDSLREVEQAVLYGLVYLTLITSCLYIFYSLVC